MKKLSVEVNGKTAADLKIALDEVKRKVEAGFLAAFDSNDSGDYAYEITDA